MKFGPLRQLLLSKEAIYRRERDDGQEMQNVKRDSERNFKVGAAFFLSWLKELLL